MVRIIGVLLLVLLSAGYGATSDGVDQVGTPRAGAKLSKQTGGGVAIFVVGGLTAIVLLAVSGWAAQATAGPTPVGHATTLSAVRLQPGTANLFVDDYLIAASEKLIRRLGQVTKYEGNPVISPEGIWEETAAFPFGGGAYRLAPDRWLLWYNTYIRWLKPSSEATSLCLATSQDGIHWEKPILEQFLVRGTRKNNVVLAGTGDNASVLYDPHDPKEARRYKLILYQEGPQASEGPGLYGYVSGDGIHWQPLPHIVLPNAGDRTNLWYDVRRKRYMLFTRYAPIKRGRYIFVTESADFEHWSEPELVFDWSAMDQVHGIQHYGATGFTYGDAYVGFLEVFHLPYRRLDTQLICSRDARHWQRVCEGEVFLSNGAEGAFDHFWAFPAASPPIRVGPELWFYYQGRGHAHGSPDPPIWPGKDESGRPRHSYWAATGLARMRLDGFASLDASGEEATLRTVPLIFEEGDALLVNANANQYPPGSSWLRVAVLWENGEPAPGFAASSCVAMTTDSVAHPIAWKSGAQLSSLAGRPIRLEFHLVNTRLYSFTVQ